VSAKTNEGLLEVVQKVAEDVIKRPAHVKTLILTNFLDGQEVRKKQHDFEAKSAC
jgi:hypothetical protein